MAFYQPLSLPDQVLAILRAQAGPAEVDYLVWRLGGKGYFASRVKRALRGLIERGLVCTSDQSEAQISGSTLVQAAPRQPGASEARLPTNPLQQLLCSPLVDVRSSV